MLMAVLLLSKCGCCCSRRSRADGAVHGPGSIATPRVKKSLGAGNEATGTVKHSVCGTVGTIDTGITLARGGTPQIPMTTHKTSNSPPMTVRHARGLGVSGVSGAFCVEQGGHVKEIRAKLHYVSADEAGSKIVP